MRRWFWLCAIALMVVAGVGGSVSATANRFIVATDVPWPPFDMVTDDGEFFGFDYDLFRAIALTAGFEFEIRQIGFYSIIESVMSGEADVGVSGFTITEMREERIDFSIPYYYSNLAVVIHKDSGLNIVTALVGDGPIGVIGAQTGAMGEWWVDHDLHAAGISVGLKTYETHSPAFIDLISGSVDAVIHDERASRAVTAGTPDDLVIAGVVNTNEYFGFIVPTGDPLALLPRIAAALRNLGLTVVDGPEGLQELVVAEGSFVEGLLEVYFGPTIESITAAWVKSKEKILAGDLDGFISSMKAELDL